MAVRLNTLGCISTKNGPDSHLLQGQKSPDDIFVGKLKINSTFTYRAPTRTSNSILEKKGMNGSPHSLYKHEKKEKKGGNQSWKICHFLTTQSFWRKKLSEKYLPIVTTLLQEHLGKHGPTSTPAAHLSAALTIQPLLRLEKSTIKKSFFFPLHVDSVVQSRTDPRPVFPSSA